MRLAANIAFVACARLVVMSALISALTCTGCSESKTVRLGSSDLYHFDPPVPVTELAATMRSDNPTLTDDLLEIYFTTDRQGGGGDIWVATRGAATFPFSAPVPVTAVNTDSFETSSAISNGGLTLWFGSDRAGGVGGLDIWATHRTTRSAPWSTPENVAGLNSTANEIPRPPGQSALVMPMASTALTTLNPVAGTYQTYLSSRPTVNDPFGAPTPIPELSAPTRSTVDGFLSADGLTLFFSTQMVSTNDGGMNAATDAGTTTTKPDLFVAWRRSTRAPFSILQPLDDLNTADDERDPWLSPDGSTLYFTSDRSGVLNIYTAHVRPR